MSTVRMTLRRKWRNDESSIRNDKKNIRDKEKLLDAYPAVFLNRNI